MTRDELEDEDIHMKTIPRDKSSVGRREVLHSLLTGGTGMLFRTRTPKEKPFKVPTERTGDVLIKILGTAQDGGLPTMGCHCQNCEDARRDPRHARMVVSLGILNFVSGRTYLLEATPDAARQVDLMQSRDPMFVKARTRPIDGVLLTHADVGHYPGLIQFRPEVGPTRGLEVHGSSQMSAFLAANEPWKYMVDKHIIELRPFEFERSIPLDDMVSFEAIPVPHQKHTDAVGFKIRGPKRTLLFIPDIDRWEERFKEIVASVDFAFIDGTYLDKREGSKRHPPIREVMAFFTSTVKTARTSVSFIHFNHDNPIFGDDGALEAEIEGKGFHVAHQGDEIWI